MVIGVSVPLQLEVNMAKRKPSERAKKDIKTVERTPEELLLLHLTTLRGAWAIFQDTVKDAHEAGKGVRALRGFDPMGYLSRLKSETDILREIVSTTDQGIKQNLEGRRWNSRETKES